MAIYQFEDDVPVVPATAWVAESAEVIGKVVLGEQSSVWPCSVLRGDTDTIRVGARTNIQDGSMIHADAGVPTTIGDDVTIGHHVMLHGCTVGDGSLIGIGAIVLNRATIGRYSIVGAGSLVTEGKSFPDGSMIVGAPARVIRQLTPEQIDGLKRNALHYIEEANRFRKGLKRIDAPASSS